MESPVGTGYSYAKTPLASEASDTKQFHQIDQFLRRVEFNFFFCARYSSFFICFFFLSFFYFVYLLQWLVDHPEFISSPFYVGGDSYAGHIVPGVVQQISLGTLTYHFCLFQSFGIF